MPAIFAALVQLLIALLSRLAGWLIPLAAVVLLDAVGVLKDVWQWTFATALKFMLSVLGSIGLGAVEQWDPATLIGSLPGTVLGVFARVGGPEALSIVVAAYTARFALDVARAALRR